MTESSYALQWLTYDINHTDFLYTEYQARIAQEPETAPSSFGEYIHRIKIAICFDLAMESLVELRDDVRYVIGEMSWYASPETALLIAADVERYDYALDDLFSLLYPHQVEAKEGFLNAVAGGQILYPNAGEIVTDGLAGMQETLHYDYYYPPYCWAEYEFTAEQQDFLRELLKSANQHDRALRKYFAGETLSDLMPDYYSYVDAVFLDDDCLISHLYQPIPEQPIF